MWLVAKAFNYSVVGLKNYERLTLLTQFGPSLILFLFSACIRALEITPVVFALYINERNSKLTAKKIKMLKLLYYLIWTVQFVYIDIRIILLNLLASKSFVTLLSYL